LSSGTEGNIYLTRLPGTVWGEVSHDLANGSTGTLSISEASPVPGPIVGAGLPGLVMAFSGLLAWRRRKAVAA
jgi:hypothetical protein